MIFLAYLYFRDAAEQVGEVWKLRLKSAKDPLLDSVDVLDGGLFEMSSSKLAMFFLACLLGYF
jgi:hypothetical protein